MGISKWQFIGSILLLIVCTGAGVYAYTKQDQVIPVGAPSYLHSTTTVPPGADLATFTVVCTGNLSCGYAKDKNAVYYNGIFLPGVDSGSFIVIDSAYAKDKNHLYYLNPNTGNTPEVIPGDPSTFRNFGGKGLYTADNQNVYWDNAPMPGANPATFSELGAPGSPTSAYGEDPHAVYHDGYVIPGADPASFQVIAVTPPSSGSAPDGYAKDSTTVYYHGTSLPGANPATFTPPTDSSGAVVPPSTSGGDTPGGTTGRSSTGTSSRSSSGSTPSSGGGTSGSSGSIDFNFATGTVNKDPNGF